MKCGPQTSRAWADQSQLTSIADQWHERIAMLLSGCNYGPGVANRYDYDSQDPEECPKTGFGACLCPPTANGPCQHESQTAGSADTSWILCCLLRHGETHQAPWQQEQRASLLGARTLLGRAPRHGETHHSFHWHFNTLLRRQRQREGAVLRVR